jgi:NTP pyrophosphatase (non-canonical NTP hydrolase)
MKVSELAVEEKLAGLAEECSELAQAALKLRRVFDGRNPTPVNEEDALEKLHEETADVMLYLDELKLNREYIRRIMEEKRERWNRRLAEK